MNRVLGKSMSGKVVQRADNCCFAVCARPADEEAWANAACANVACENEASASGATSNSLHSPHQFLYAFLRRKPASGGFFVPGHGLPSPLKMNSN